MEIHWQEEIYWQQRGKITWTLKGEALTTYFFGITNGRQRRCSIVRLIINDVNVSDPVVIQEHIYEFFFFLTGC